MIILISVMVMDDVMDAAATCHEGQRQRIRDRRHDDRAKASQPCTAKQRFQNCDQLMPEFAVEHRHSNSAASSVLKLRRRVADDLGADHRRDRVIRRDDPRQVRIHAQQRRDAIEVEQERDEDREHGVEAEERREAEEHAERERRGRSLRRVGDVEQRVQPARISPLVRRIIGSGRSRAAARRRQAALPSRRAAGCRARPCSADPRQ